MTALCSKCKVGIIYQEGVHDLKQVNALRALKGSSSTSNVPGAAHTHVYNLLDLLCNSESMFEFPLCEDCASKSETDMRKQLEELETECTSYNEALDKLESRMKRKPSDIDALRREASKVTREEQELLETLQSLEQQESELKAEEFRLNDQADKITEGNNRLYDELRRKHRNLIENYDERHSINLHHDYVTQNLAELSHSNLLDVVFFITIEDLYATINGLRLGRLPDIVVEWSEINAAFGQVALLIQVLAERLGIVFDRYEIECRGSNSSIREISGDKTTTYPLSSQGGWKSSISRSLDDGIVGLLRCYEQIYTELEKQKSANTDLSSLYPVRNDLIYEGDISFRVKIQFSSQERWTKAMKLFLLNLKRVILFVR